jgi:hypothetical protein
MIHDYVKNVAAQIGMSLSRVEIVNGQDVGCLDVSLVKITTKGHTVRTLVYQADIDNLKNGNECDLLKLKILAALSRLKMLLET